VRPLNDSDLEWADVAMVSGMLVQKESSIGILKRCRDFGVRTVVGGPMAGTVPELREYADTLVIGEAEDLMGPLCLALEQGTAEPEYRVNELPDLAKTPRPALELINAKHYSAMAIQFSRGCPFNCEFCDIIEMFGHKPRTKAVSQVLSELDQLYERKWRGSVFLVDDNFIGNKKLVKQLLLAMAEWNNAHGRPFAFFTEASVNLADDEELLSLMRDAGFFRVFLGIETPVEASLKAAQKLQNTKRSLLDCVKRIQHYGLEVMAGFIVGFDSDTEDVFDRQVEFIQESAIPLAMVGLLQALPGTQLYRRLLKEGRLLADGTGNNTDLALNFLPKMDPRLLIEGYRSILKRIYDRDAYYERVRKFLARYEPAHHYAHKLSDYTAFLRSLWRQGVLDKDRVSYWKFILEAAIRYRHAFSTAVTLAVQGYHLRVITQRVMESEFVTDFEPSAGFARS